MSTKMDELTELFSLAVKAMWPAEAALAPPNSQVRRENIGTEDDMAVFGNLSIRMSDDGQYIVEESVLVPGVWRYPDGSGQPDDVDIIEVGVFSKATDAIRAALHRVVDRTVDVVAENYGIDKMLKEDSQYE